MFSYDGRRLQTIAGPAGRLGSTATYHHAGDLVWGDICGPHVRQGSLAGRCDADGALEVAYLLILHSGDVVAGRSLSRPTVLPDGRIRLFEHWEHYARDTHLRGTGELEEVVSGPARRLGTYV